MDPVSQGAFGAIFAQTISNKKKLLAGSILGCIAGLAPDIDIFIRSGTDPLLKLEFHRQFTHSLVFIPIGALLVTLLSRLFFKKYFSWVESYIICFVGYATSGLLDACTSYGTQLFWPFSDERIAWRIIAIVDPVFSLILLIAIIAGLRSRKQQFARFGLLLAGCYLILGLYQHNRALEAATQLALQRGHAIERQIVKPTMANIILWRSIYQSGGQFYVDGIRIAPFSDSLIYAGERIRQFIPERD